MLGLIKRSFASRNENIMINMYRQYVRPHLEYATQVWNPSYKIDIERLEKIQRRATKMIAGYSNLVYNERLRKAGLASLSNRRTVADMIHVFKLLGRME